MAVVSLQINPINPFALLSTLQVALQGHSPPYTASMSDTVWVVQECERQKASADRSAWQRASFRYKFAAHALLAGERKIADVLLRVTPPPFTCHVVRSTCHYCLPCQGVTSHT